MKTRIISGLIMAPLLIFLYLRGIPLALAALAISMMAVYEFLRGFSKVGVTGNLFVCWGMNILLYIIHFFAPGRHDWILFWIVLSVCISCISIFRLERHRIEDALATIATIVYIEFFIYHIIMIDETSYGILVWMVAITAFCTDIFAYFTGHFIGKNKLCPNLSPKKTVEGAVGGIVGAILGSIIFGLIVKIEIFPHMILMGLFGGVMAQLGDLTASAFKRKMGIKDYGNLIPGHGGILDRFDSILFTAPAIYYYLELMIAK